MLTFWYLFLFFFLEENPEGPEGPISDLQCRKNSPFWPFWSSVCGGQFGPKKGLKRAKFGHNGQIWPEIWRFCLQMTWIYMSKSRFLRFWPQLAQCRLVPKGLKMAIFRPLLGTSLHCASYGNFAKSRQNVSIFKARNSRISNFDLKIWLKLAVKANFSQKSHKWLDWRRVAVGFGLAVR